jgi:hypothetical protein
MTKNLIIIALLLLVIYYYRNQKKPNITDSDLQKQLTETIRINKTFASFCQNEIGGKDIEEIRRKLNGRKLSEILEENEDYETEVDTLRRTKNELEADLLSQSNSFKSLLREKEGIIKRLEKEKKDLQEFGKKELEKLKKGNSDEESKIEKALDQVIKGINDLNKELD